ncbi:MAG: hypothetical protein VX498_11735 [Myxococcota bacterium]|nr:hypothetical protein [Myxococcota bacterium]
MDSFVSVQLEIRAPQAHVLAIAGRVTNTVDWLWAPVQVANVASSRDLPDGTRQLVIADGDKLRDRVVESEEQRLVIASEFRPRREEVRGRSLMYELSVEAGLGTTLASLALSFSDRDNPTQTVEVRRWRRHLEQCLARLAALAVPEEESGAD